MPRISIVIPMFNVERYIRTCIESILAQSFKNFELIIIDDCSTDRSAEIVRSFKDPRIRFFQLAQNSGAGKSINDGIKTSRGEFVYVMDSDDAIMPETLQTLLDAAEKFDADVIHMSRYYRPRVENFRMGEKVPIDVVREKNPQLGLQTQTVQEILSRFIEDTFYPMWLNFYRGSFLRDRKILPPEFKDGSHDFFFLLATKLTAKRFVKIERPLYIYRILSRDSFTNSNSEKKLSRFVSSLPIMLKYLKDLFAREDLIAPIPRETQIDVSTRAILKVFFDLATYPVTVKSHREIVSRIVSRPEFYTRDFMEDFMILFLNSQRFRR